jgi:hypothetical protein
VGTAGYFIDLAVKDPEHTGRYVLAIECDGASYHSSRSARDRDRLRQGVLESLGWRFHRIWSTDWFRDSVKELERTIEAIESARAALKANKPIESTVKPVRAPVINRAASVAEESATMATAYRKAVLPPWKYAEALHEAPSDHLIGMIKSVSDIEAPVHESDVTRRLMDAFGVSRARSRITEAVSAAIQQGHRSGTFHFFNGFVYSDKTKLANVRNRNAFESAEKKIEHVAPEELDAALLEVVRMGFSIEQDAAIIGALDSLGFGRATANISSAMKARLKSLISRGSIKRDEERLTAV